MSEPKSDARLARLREYFATDTGTLIPVDICEPDSHLQSSPRVYLAADVEAAIASPQADARQELCRYLDVLTITSDNIGDVRCSFLMPFDGVWNGWVRDETASRENHAGRAGPPPAEASFPKMNEAARRAYGAGFDAGKSAATTELVQRLAAASTPAPEPEKELVITGSELDYVTHAANLRGQSLLEYVKRAINAALMKQGVDAVLFGEDDEAAAPSAPPASAGPTAAAGRTGIASTENRADTVTCVQCGTVVPSHSAMAWSASGPRCLQHEGSPLPLARE